MAVADLEESTFRVNGDEECRANDQVLIVEVAGVNPWRRTADASGDFRRGHAHASEKRMQGDLDSFSKERDHASLVQRNDFPSRIREILRQEAAAGKESVEGIWKGETDLLDSNFQDVAGLGTLDVDRSGQYVPARPLIVNLPVNVPQRLFDLARLRACGFELIRAETN